jgi:hypothetical protein
VHERKKRPRSKTKHWQQRRRGVQPATGGGGGVVSDTGEAFDDAGVDGHDNHGWGPVRLDSAHDVMGLPYKRIRQYKGKALNNTMTHVNTFTLPSGETSNTNEFAANVCEWRA